MIGYTPNSRILKYQPTDRKCRMPQENPWKRILLQKKRIAQLLRKCSFHREVLKNFPAVMVTECSLPSSQISKLTLQSLAVLTFQNSTGRFIMFSVITNIYNQKTKGPTLMEMFTSNTYAEPSTLLFSISIAP